MDHCTAKPVTRIEARERQRMEELWTQHVCVCVYIVWVCMCGFE